MNYKRTMLRFTALLLTFLLITACGTKELKASGENNYSVSDLSEEKQELTVMTYNVKDCDNGEKISEIAEEIQKYNPDVVCVQEIDMNASRSGKRNILKELSEKVQMNYCFFPAIRLQGGTYGIGILSVYPLENCALQPLDVRKGDEERILASAEISVNGQTVHIYNTHLSFEDRQTRLQQIKTLNTVISQNTPFILTGDFNTESFQEFSYLSGVYAANTEETPYQTYIGDDADTVFRSIDNIFVHDNFEMKDVTLGTSTASDHRPLIAAICL